jgi:hypothetical protein
MKEIEKLEQMSGPKLFGFGQDHADLSYSIFRYNASSFDTVVNRTTLGVYENASKKLSLWADIVFEDKLGGNGSVQRVQSTCRDECKPQYKRVLRRPAKCCWSCVRCRPWKIVTDHFTYCDYCPKAHWPNPYSNFTTCYALTPKELSLTDINAITHIVMASLQTFFLGCVLAAFIRYRAERVIKATNIELSMLMLLGILLGNVNLLVSSAPASDPICAAYAILDELAYGLPLYSLFSRTLLIFLIFRSKSKFSRQTMSGRLILSKTFWLCFSVGLVTFDLILTLLVLPTAMVSQPDMNNNYTERHCDEGFTMGTYVPGQEWDWHLVILALKTGFKTTVTLTCFGLAFLSRHLPSNYNESTSIVICVASEIFSKSMINIIADSMPKHLEKAQIYAFGGALDQLNYLVFLFVPKIIAVLHPQEEKTGGRLTTYGSVFVSKNLLSTPMGGGRARHDSTASIHIPAKRVPAVEEETFVKAVVSSPIDPTQQHDIGDSVSLPDYGDSASLENKAHSDKADNDNSGSAESKARSDKAKLDNSGSLPHSDNILQASTDKVPDGAPLEAQEKDGKEQEKKSSTYLGSGLFPLYSALLANSSEDKSESQLAG